MGRTRHRISGPDVGLFANGNVPVQTGGLPAAYQDAYELIERAERATLVTLHAGEFPVAGLTAYDMLPVGSALDVTLHFATAGASLTLAQQLQLLTEGDDAIMTEDSVGITARVVA